MGDPADAKVGKAEALPIEPLNGCARASSVDITPSAGSLALLEIEFFTKNCRLKEV